MSTRRPVIRNGMYYGSISIENATDILGIRELSVVQPLKKMIFNFPLELVMRSIEEKKSVRKICEDESIDMLQYLGELRDYQTVGTAFMYLSKRSIIGDGVGLGKTAEISALINYLKLNKKLTRFLMAVETSALAQTQAELIKFTGLRVVTLPSEADKMQRQIKKIDWNTVDGIIIKHGALKSSMFSTWIANNLNSEGMCNIFNTFILDESSVIKNAKTKVFEYTQNLCNIVPRVHFMNATTFETNLMDIYYQVDMMDDKLLPSKSRIMSKYCNMGERSYWSTVNGKAEQRTAYKVDSYKNQAEFKEGLKLVYFGRCKKDVGMQLPNIYKVYEIQQATWQAEAIAQGYRYNEVLNSPDNIPQLDRQCTRANVPKLDRLCRLVADEFDGQQVMVYCWHKSAQLAIKEELEKIGRKVAILNGEDTSKDKDMNRYRIQTQFNEGIYDVIVTNIKKSLNLGSGDVCIFYSMISNPATMFQVAGRIDRNTNDKLKTFILLLYKNTAEYEQATCLARERGQNARDFTIDAETTIDYFMQSLDENGSYE